MTDNTMKAVRFHDYGGPEVLVIDQIPQPVPGDGQVLIRVHVAAVNPADWKIRAGYFKQFMPMTLPVTPGLEGAGVVAAVGAGVTQFKPGDAIFGPFTGSNAEYAVAPASDVFLKPANLSFEQAATVPVGALTAWAAVIETAQVQKGQRVLVHGAAGGVGLYAAQLARWKGAHVTGTASTGNAAFVRSLGVDEVIDYSHTAFETVVHDLDAVIDTVGGDLAERSLKVIRRGGIFVTVAGRIDPEMGQALGIRASNAGRTGTDKLNEIVKLIETGQVKTPVGKVFEMADIRKAHELSQAGHGAGRIVLHIGG